jgi:hypothetical protein
MHEQRRPDARQRNVQVAAPQAAQLQQRQEYQYRNTQHAACVLAPRATSTASTKHHGMRHGECQQDQPKNIQGKETVST